MIVPPAGQCRICNIH